MTPPLPDSDSNLTDAHPDYLSPRAVEILEQHTTTAYQRLVVKEPTPSATQQALAKLSPQDLLSVEIADVEESRAVLAAMWLWLDGLDEAHKIVQDLVGPTGAFWHGSLRLA